MDFTKIIILHNNYNIKNNLIAFMNLKIIIILVIYIMIYIYIFYL